MPFGGFVHSVTPVDGDLFRIVSTEMLAEAEVTILYGAQVVGIDAGQSGVNSVTCAVKGGLRTIEAGHIVDASGDADVAVGAGAGFRRGHSETGKMQPVSMLLRCFSTDNARIAEELAVSEPAMATRPEFPDPFPVYFNGTFARWNDIVVAEGLFPNRDHKVFFNTVWPHHINVNTSAVFGVDGTDPLALSRATVELTRHAGRIGDFLRKHVPGFENAYMMPAIFPGVRETRHIKGLYEISDVDVDEGRSHDDSVGRVCFPVDIHDPDTGQAEFHQIGGDGTFDIPYRALVPAGVDNVIVAGRCISVSSYAHGATRNMAPCLVMGQAAGTAAAQASADHSSFPDLDVSRLQAALKRAGVWA
ncbi:MAG: FAD-dependent oxidoreductase [Nocardioidaceae bacterium]